MQGRQLDRDELHRLLWERASGRRRPKIEIHQGEYARELKVNNSTMSAALKDLVDAGKIRKLQARKMNVATYIVRDPAEFDA